MSGPVPDSRLTSTSQTPGLATALVIAGLLGAALYVGRELFVSLALAILFSFVLGPLVLLLRGLRVPRAPAVLIVVTLAFATIAALGMLMGRQIAGLAEELPRYEMTLRAKIQGLRPMPGAPAGMIERATEALEGLSRELERQPTAPAGPAAANATSRPIPVEIHQPPLRALDYYQSLIAPLLGPLARAGLVVIFVIFILLQREELRDRFIRLFGGEDFQRATAAMTDAAERLSRYFLTLTAMNVAYGAVMTVALWLMGIPAPVLWGILAGLMRYVPYIGSFIAAAFPVLLAAAVEPGWSLLAATLALYVLGELTMGQVMEPWLLGNSTGLTPLAVLVSASFWTWLWGPVGLLLAVPLTICLIVLGRHVPQLRFIYVLLGDEPALTPPQRFYHRMLAGDIDEITFDAEQFLKKGSLVDYFDEVTIPGLAMAQADAKRGRLPPERLEEMKALVDELIGELEDVDVSPPQHRIEETARTGPERRLPVLSARELPRAWQADCPLLCVGLRNSLDHAAAKILAHLSTKHGLPARVLEPADLGPTAIANLDLSTTQLVILSTIDPARSPAYARLVIRRLRRRKPNLPVLIGAWGKRDAVASGGETEQGLEATPRADTLRDALATILAAPWQSEVADARAASVELAAPAE